MMTELVGSGGLAQAILYAKQVYWQAQHLLHSYWEKKNGTESAQSHHTKGQWCKKLIKPCYRRGSPGIWRPSENNTVVLGLTTPFSSRVYAKFQGSKTLPPSQLQPQSWPYQVYPSARPQKWIPFILSSEMLRKS